MERDNQISLVTQEAFLEEATWWKDEQMTGERWECCRPKEERCEQVGREEQKAGLSPELRFLGPI